MASTSAWNSGDRHVADKLTHQVCLLDPSAAWSDSLSQGGWAVLAALGLLWTVAMSVQLNSWLLDLSPFNHIPRLPGREMTATPLIWLVAGVTILVVVGLAGFRRRDVEAA